MKAIFYKKNNDEKIDFNKNQLLILNNSNVDLIVINIPAELNHNKIFRGVVIFSSSDDWNVGDISDDFSKEKFIKYQEELILKN